MKQSRTCELCAGEAAVYCGSDAAFLCWACDAAVHGANFLVARHVRRAACAACRALDDRSPRVSGAGSATRALLCRSCAPDQPDDGASESESDPEPGRRPPSPAVSASSSSCLSTSESASAAAPPRKPSAGRRTPAPAKRRRLHGRAEGVLIWWCRRMGLRGEVQCAAARAIDSWGAATAAAAAALPPRVALAAALWSAIKLSEEEGAGGAALLRRLEACSGVPARLIVVAESRIAARSAGRVRVMEEGWAECS